MQQKVNLRAGWDVLWNNLSSGMPPATQRVLLMIAAALAAYSVLEWVVSNHSSRGSGGKSKRVAWGLFLAAIFAAPGVIIPVIMSGIDLVANLILSAFSG